MSRPGWDAYFMDIVELVKTRSTCLRRQVGALIVKDRRILATGYNGSPMGTKHCAEVGCLREKLNIPSGQRHDICRAAHAEQNAIVQAAYSGTCIKDSDMYITTQPCSICAKLIINAGIKKIVFKGDYPDDLAMSLLNEAGVRVVKYHKDMWEDEI
jgi:dCMP deaminase